jgi:hypothetical protein
VQALCASAENAYGVPCLESRIEANLWHAEEQMDSYSPNAKAGHALMELGFRIQREISVNSAVTGKFSLSVKASFLRTRRQWTTANLVQDERTPNA